MRISILSPTLANQIAAGEVIERPASVVKELVENAIDAKSTHITVIVEEAGLNKIEVRDNGEGIPSAEVARAFERHATSKIHSDEDLFRIRSLGFRGEALPSIASVSHMTIETAVEGSNGKKMVLIGGEVVEDISSSSRKGTRVVVENIFFNTPARLKYLKTLQTELAHITDIVNRLALAHPTISFHLIHDGNHLIKTPGNGETRQAIAGIYGVDAGKKMRTIQNTNLNFSVAGFVSLPELTRASKRYITLIVNGRYINNFLLRNAVVKGYGSKLMVGRYPVAVVKIDMDPLLLDVNVHPTKQEIRISDEKELARLVEEAVSKAISPTRRIPNALENITSGQSQHNKNTYHQENIRFIENNELTDQNKLNYFKENRKDELDTTVDESKASILVNKNNEEDHQKQDTSLSEQGELTKRSEKIHDNENTLAIVDRLMENKAKKTDGEKPFPRLDYIGQMHGTYLIAQNEEGLFFIDQHAAQERIKYEYYRSTIAEEGTVLQELLTPIVLDYPVNDALVIKEYKVTLEEAGIFLEDFGQNSFLMRAHPSWFKHGQEEDTVKEMIDFLLEKQELSLAKFKEATAIMMSCKRSIKANHYLSDLEARALLEELKQTKNPYNCPHGRPVIVHFSTIDMEKMFKRIQDPH
ncbi:DNA mismatch repair endonuclease MutL [Lacticigenium naphthae]|uniref:DNA mismatch repair endonuclease MutL n=1 Tax=Lacticigenium naphthae TaxID=515351 RepID=UPI0004032AAF|nr:DNA mismatch repair endonuclease MutL [Lacticigenium naphthae]